MKSKTPKPKKQKQKISIDQAWEMINPKAAGIDIGSREHLVCAPPGASPNHVRSFGTFTADLEALADWLKECGVTSAYSGGCRTVNPMSVGQASDFCRTPLRSLSDRVPGSCRTVF